MQYQKRTKSRWLEHHRKNKYELNVRKLTLAMVSNTGYGADRQIKMLQVPRKIPGDGDERSR